MYLKSTLWIDPAQLTHVKRVKPTKGFGKLASFLTAGLSLPKEESETFGALAVLQQINVVMRSLGIDNLVRLWKDDVIFYDDREGREGDLKAGLEHLAANTTQEQSDLFGRLQLVLEHKCDERKYDDLNLLIAIRINRVHAVGEHPIQIVINGVSNEMNATGGEEQVRQRMENVFISQYGYDSFVEKHQRSFNYFVEQVEEGFRKQMEIDDLHREDSTNILRPKHPIKNRQDRYYDGHHGHGYHDDPLYDDYHGNDDAFFYCWLWSEFCYDHNIHCHDCTIVNDQGDQLIDVGPEGIDAGQDNTLNPDTPITALPEDTGHGDVAPDVNTSSSDTDRSGGGGGWLSSFMDSFSSDSDSSSDGGSSCSSCGGCGGGGE